MVFNGNKIRVLVGHAFGMCGEKPLCAKMDLAGQRPARNESAHVLHVRTCLRHVSGQTKCTFTLCVHYNGCNLRVSDPQGLRPARNELIITLIKQYYRDRYARYICNCYCRGN